MGSAPHVHDRARERLRARARVHADRRHPGLHRPPRAGDIHTRFWSFVARQRLLDANGTAANHVIYISNNAGSGAMNLQPLTIMDAWLAAMPPRRAAGARPRGRSATGRQGSATRAGRRRRRGSTSRSGSRLHGRLRGALPDVGRHAARGRAGARERHPQVPAEAARPRRLRGRVRPSRRACRRRSRAASATGRSTASSSRRGRRRAPGSTSARSSRPVEGAAVLARPPRPQLGERPTSRLRRQSGYSSFRQARGSRSWV